MMQKQRFEEEEQEEAVPTIDENDAQENKKREIAIPGEVIVSGKDFLPGDGTRREGDKIIASRFGLADISGRLVKVIPLSGIYTPRMGNVVIGRVEDVTFNGWILNVNSPYNSFLSVNECSRFIKGDLTEYFDIGDMIVCKVFSVKRKGIDLTIRARGLGKIEQGMIMKINSNKVPRVIGKAGSMINLIKENTNCEITVGQNGVIWIFGENYENEFKAKKAIEFVVSKSFIEGLTDKVKEWFDKENKEKK